MWSDNVTWHFVYSLGYVYVMCVVEGLAPVFPRLCVVESVEVVVLCGFAIPINSFCAH
jgi:hypothetical protein